MKYRVLPLALAAALIVPVATPAAAQHYSNSYNFLSGVKDNDGNKVTEAINNSNGRVVNAKDPNSGEGALHIVVKQNNATYLRFLLAKGADPDIQDKDGNTPAILAVENGFDGAIDILARYHANFNVANDRGETPLIRAVQMRDLVAVHALLDAGADPDQTDNIAGMSARDYAKRDGRSPQIVKAIENAPKKKKADDIIGPHL
ncbi:ankyrin repeat domain-containing protein [Stakelama marina]|uniref:Ankyrin repeat domain-containing protein n=1 Tax=Stakelama marina TaxID=2826939 RepID=A0A8T4IG06_9SPHN|nr:ankyrin repeat domain-containing protein [Stakelama marina]MBR0552972.1 ankyrin repeat domain-containing protein [Stakelama marina]